MCRWWAAREGIGISTIAGCTRYIGIINQFCAKERVRIAFTLVMRKLNGVQKINSVICRRSPVRLERDLYQELLSHSLFVRLIPSGAFKGWCAVRTLQMYFSNLMVSLSIKHLANEPLKMALLSIIQTGSIVISPALLFLYRDRCSLCFHPTKS